MELRRWLQRVWIWVRRIPPTERTVPLLGAIIQEPFELAQERTGWVLQSAIGKNTLYLDASVLCALPGYWGEHYSINEAKVESLVESMRVRGFLRDYTVRVIVEDGLATIREGNHRIRAAMRLGLPVPTIVRYKTLHDTAWRPTPHRDPVYALIA
jgi:hypothetical protein